jgi:CheY-like chemotaxis protein
MTVIMALTSLLVCSDAEAVQVLSRILQDLGIEVESCGHLRMARARLEDRHFDAVLVDCDLGPAAVELIAQARNSPNNKTAVAIAIVSEPQEVHTLLAKGANFALNKPISHARAGHSMRAARDLMRNERRIRRRIAVQAKSSITYADQENVPVALLDLSEKGIAFRSDSKLPPYCKVYFQFALPGNPSPVRLSGEVMWQDSCGRVGIRFAQVPATSRRLLDDWLRANSSSPSEILPSGSHTSADDDDSGLRLTAGLGLLSVSAADRRGLSRCACYLGAEVYGVHSVVAIRCSLIDIGSGGCYIKTAETFPIGTFLRIVVRTEDLRLRIHAKVVSMHPGVGMGVNFNLRTDDQRKQVQRLIDCVQSEAKVSI